MYLQPHPLNSDCSTAAVGAAIDGLVMMSRRAMTAYNLVAAPTRQLVELF